MKIYYADINDFDEAFFERAFEKIPTQKKESISRFKNERAKKESLLGWYLFSFGAKEAGIKEVEIVFSQKGKPFIENSAFHFNISHSDGFVCCAFCESEVGIDVEKPKAFSPSVINRVLTENEKKVLEKSPDKEKTFIRFWTLKESFLKQSGEGITGGLLSLDFSDFFEKKSFEYRNQKFITGELDGFLFSVCSEDGEAEFTAFKETLGVD